MSAPHDHDLNPIAERVIGVISEDASAIRSASNASADLWPWLIKYAVDWHNSMAGAVGSSTADPLVSPTQRLTQRQPAVMDLAAFLCRAVVLEPPAHQHKPSLKTRGAVGSFLGRSLTGGKSSYDVLLAGNRGVRTSSAVHYECGADMRDIAQCILLTM